MAVQSMTVQSMTMEIEEIVSRVDYTLLKQDATWEEIKLLCDDALRFHVASVCIPPSYVKQAADYLQGRLPVCTVIGFPNGYQTSAVKQFETKDALVNGAAEIDMVVNLGWVREGRFDLAREEIGSIKEICGRHILKVIIETCFLTRQEKIRMCEAVTKAGADYIKTSTGFGAAGATFEDVELFAAHIGKNVKIKAAGGINSLEDAQKFLELGAGRLGTSRIVKLLKEGD